MTPTRRIEVAAAVILRSDGRFLLAQRPSGKPYAGYWEFPGGKVEDGESPRAALSRELHEELGIEVERAYPWITRDYDYAHAAVRLRFFRVPAWHGVLHGREAQQFAWQLPQGVTVAPLLPANGPVLRALALPPVYGITNAVAFGAEAFLGRLERALAGGLKLLQFREKTLDETGQRRLAARLIELAHRYGARVLVNGTPGFVREVGADGVHLPAALLGTLASRPDFDLVGVSCHDEAELQHAAQLGADLAVLGPVLPTPTHPGAPTLGWQRFAALVRDCPLPVYALGGMRHDDLDRAWCAGAHGISMLRGAWE
ncbi:MAG: Nudix family hydrolase [Betaproteobacteria bacterium]